MNTYQAMTTWTRQGAPFIDNRYSRAHTWTFDGGVRVPASASPHVVPLPQSSAEAVDPEEAFVASLSSCHLLWFLSLAAEAGFCVEHYVDEAEGFLGKNVEGKIAMTRVVLRPRVTFVGSSLPTSAQHEALHHAAHDRCFIANSVKTSVSCEPTFASDVKTEASRLP